MPDLAATIRSYAARLIWCVRADGARPRVDVAVAVAATPRSVDDLRREAEEWAAELGPTADPETYISGRRSRAQAAWDYLLPEIDDALAAAQTRLGPIPAAPHLPEVEDDDTCGDCGDSGDCSECDGAGDDVRGETCDTCHGSGCCSACTTD